VSRPCLWMAPAALLATGLLGAAPARAAGQGPAGRDQEIVTGDAGPGLEHLDRAVLAVMRHKGIPGATLAIAKDGKLVLARGYGLANTRTGQPVRPTSLFNLASCSKPITAAAVLKLVDDGDLRLDDRVFRLAPGLKPRGARADPRLDDITVRQLLHHAGGFSRDGARREGPEPLKRFVRRGLRLPLAYDPGARTQYSNFGFLVLRLVVAEVTGEGYEEYTVENVLRPMGITDMRLDPRARGYVRGEVRRYRLGGEKMFPGGRGPIRDGGGSWLASSVDAVRFLCALDGSRGKPALSQQSVKEMLSRLPTVRPHRDGSYTGLGWDVVKPMDGGFLYRKNGGVPGIATYMEHRPDGVNWALFFNASPGAGSVEKAGAWRRPIQEAIEKTEQWPDVDLFREYR
jgi:CubicO group peptidase (beta-lactamase class C family)